MAMYRDRDLMLRLAARGMRGRFPDPKDRGRRCHPFGMGNSFSSATGGVVAVLLNHRLIAPNPPGSPSVIPAGWEPGQNRPRK